MSYDSDSWGAWREPKSPNIEELDIIKDAKKRFHFCQEWEAHARTLWEYDYKFANGDSHNKYQWDSDIITSRELEDKPILTINKTKVHNLLVINDAKQNKPGIRIRPVGEEASYDGAKIYQELIYHIEYISSAENVYDAATTWQVEAGIGYWRVITDYVSDDSFDQEVYIRRIKDPRSVYLDPNINEVDGSDARFGFIFEDMPKDLFKAKYPEFASIAGSSVLGNTTEDGWITRDNVRVCEYYCKTEKKDKLVTFETPDGQQIIAKYSELGPDLKQYYKSVKQNSGTKERKIITNDIEWYKIAGDRIIDKGVWLGKYIPIVRLPGTETVIDGIWDVKGHTRSLINAQQMYNYNTSASIEYGALQTKAPWLAPADAIEGYEEYYKSANTQNYSYLPYNHMGEDGQPIPPPSRPAPPQASPAYVQQLQIAQNEMMMATGQYQAQFGQNENAKSGVAINARQRQGDRVTYHFIDNLAIAIRFTGKILIDLIPKIYDTNRVMQILARDGTILNVNIDPNAPEGYKKVDNPQALSEIDKNKKMTEIIFNPKFGIYDIQSDSGPSYATRRTEAFDALTQIAAQNKEFMNIGGDLLWKVADFPEADVLAERWRKVIPPNITGDGLDPSIEEVMQKASAQIEQLTAQLTDATKKLTDKEREQDLKAQELLLKEKQVSVEQQRLDYEAETRRLTALGNSGPGISIEQIQPLVAQLVRGMMEAGEPGSGESVGTRSTAQMAQERSLLEGSDGEGGQENASPEPSGEAGEASPEEEQPPIEGAKLAPDGNYYVKHDDGSYSRVDM